MPPTRLAKWLFVLVFVALGGPGSLAQEAAAQRDDQAPAADNNAAGEKPQDEPKADQLLTRHYKRAMTIDVRGPIFAPLKSYLFNRIEVAKQGNVDLILFRIHSPGGSLDDSVELSRAIAAIDWATTIAYVPEEAYSGAAILVLGCDRIFMHPRAVLGDAGPIELDGDAFRFVEQKRVSAIAAVVGQLAEAKNRPPALAEAMVDRKLSVFEATHKQTGQRRYLTSEQIKLAEFTNTYDIGPALPETGLDRFLTVGGTRAAELRLVEGTYESEDALVSRLHFDSMRETEWTWVDGTVFFLNRPLVTGLLLLIGLIGLYIEFTVPGISVAGMVSLISFAIFFWSHALGGTSAGWRSCCSRLG